MDRKTLRPPVLSLGRSAEDDPSEESREAMMWRQTLRGVFGMDFLPVKKFCSPRAGCIRDKTQLGFDQKAQEISARWVSDLMRAP